MKSDNENVQRWLDNEHFQNFLRQAHTDIYVGLKNGVSQREIKNALQELCRCIQNSIELPAPPEFDDLVDSGRWYDFYGVCDTCFKLGSQVYDAVEDPDDGYRSYLSSVVLSNADNLTFSRFPFVKVQVRSAGDFYEFVDAVGHVWVTIGTDHSDDYYPCFTFSYSPPKGLPE